MGKARWRYGARPPAVREFVALWVSAAARRLAAEEEPAREWVGDAMWRAACWLEDRARRLAGLPTEAEEGDAIVEAVRRRGAQPAEPHAVVVSVAIPEGATTAEVEALRARMLREATGA